MRNFAIMQTICQEQAGKESPIPDRPKFRIIETYSTLDGPRSRLVNGGYSTIEEAIGSLYFMQENNLRDLQKDVEIMQETIVYAKKG